MAVHSGDTGVKYGLRIGPLVALRRPDPSDDRHRWEQATKAAARYLKDLYATDAQASGLLVMASYNWGENRVIRLIQSMPANPRQRNFWRLLDAVQGPNSAGNLRLRLLHRLGGGDRREPAAIRLQLRQSAGAPGKQVVAQPYAFVSGSAP